MRKPSLTEFSHPRKPVVEELLLIDANLGEVVEALQELLKRVSTRKVEASTDRSDAIYARSLYCFAVVSYIRCFTAGYRTKLEISKVPGITFIDRKLHEEIRAVRNKYLAHAVDSTEEAAHLYLRAPYSGAAPTEFIVFLSLLACDAPATLRHFVRVVGKVRRHVVKRAAAIGDEIATDVFGKRATWHRCYAARTRKPYDS